MTSRLQQAVEAVYEAFLEVSPPRSIEGCPCCIDDKEIKILLTKPLRELKDTDLSSYASSVFLTVGSTEDFLYFLPRILEILVSNSDWWPDPEVVARAIHNSGFRRWPESRRQAVLHYFDEVLLNLLNNEDATVYKLDTWMCALGRMHLDLIPYLQRIAEKPLILIEYHEKVCQNPNPFWEDVQKEYRQVVKWFNLPEIQQIIKGQK